MSIAKKLIDTLKSDIPTTYNKDIDSYLQLVGLFPLQSIVKDKQYKNALKVSEKLISLMNLGVLGDEGVKLYLTTLAELVSDYEDGQYKTGAVSGREILAYLMELQGLTQKDLAHEVGGQSVVSKILNGERELNLRQIKALAKRFKVSPVVFF